MYFDKTLYLWEEQNGNILTFSYSFITFTNTVRKGHNYFVNTAAQTESSETQANRRREGRERRG